MGAGGKLTMLRYFTFRFLHSRRHTTRDITIAGTHQPDCLTAAWAVLRDMELRDAGFTRDDWRVLAVTIRPVIDLAAVLA